MRDGSRRAPEPGCAPPSGRGRERFGKEDGDGDDRRRGRVRPHLEGPHGQAARSHARHTSRPGEMGLGGQFLDPHLRPIGRCPGRRLSDRRSIADAGGLDSGERQDPDRDLCHARAWRPLLRPRVDPGALPTRTRVAIPEVVKAMQAQLSSDAIDDFWRKRFPGQIPDHLAAAEPFEGEELDLEGHKLVVVKTERPTRPVPRACTSPPSTDRRRGCRLQRHSPVSR